MLSDAGYEVIAVANGQAAPDAARGAEVGFTMVVTNNYKPFSISTLHEAAQPLLSG